MYYLFLFGALISCGREDSSTQHYIQLISNSGSIGVHGNMNANDAIFDTLHKVYYDNGNLRNEVSYFNGKKDGKEIGYYENNVLEHVGYYKNDKKDSIWIYYYNIPNAVREPLKIIEYWRNGIQVSHQILFYPNGEVDTYVFCGPLGNPVYRSSYSEEGTLIREEGVKAPQLVITTDEESVHKLSIDDSLRVKIYTIEPPNAVTHVFVKIEGIDNDWIEATSNTFFDPIFYKRKLTKVGKYQLKVKLQIKNNKEVGNFTNQIEFEIF